MYMKYDTIDGRRRKAKQSNTKQFFLSTFGVTFITTKPCDFLNCVHLTQY